MTKLAKEENQTNQHTKKYIDREHSLFMAAQEKHSLVIPNISTGSYDILYKAEGYHDADFEITVEPTGETTFSHPVIPMARGEIWLQSPETYIPSEVYLEDPTDFTFYISNTGDMDAEYATRIEFESIDLPEQVTFIFPKEDGDLIWSDRIPYGAYTVNYVTVTLPSDAIPADKEEAAFDIYVQLLAK